MLIYIYSIYHLFNCLGKFKEDKMKPFASVKKKKKDGKYNLTYSSYN